MTDTALAIEKNVPLPTERSRKNGIAATLRSMQPGNSVFVPGKTRNNISSQCNMQKLRCADGRDYVTRTVEGGVRVWRTV